MSRRRRRRRLPGRLRIFRAGRPSDCWPSYGETPGTRKNAESGDVETWIKIGRQLMYWIQSFANKKNRSRQLIDTR